MLIRVKYISMSLYIWIRRIQDLFSMLLLEQSIRIISKFSSKSSITVNASIFIGPVIYGIYSTQIMYICITLVHTILS
jgi:hypothetical protein